MSKSNTVEKPVTSGQAATNILAHAVEHGPVEEVILTEEEAEAVREFLARPTPAAPNLRAAMERAKRFKFIAK
jgi:uncharacterized protein (DUF1778 family)